MKVFISSKFKKPQIKRYLTVGISVGIVFLTINLVLINFFGLSLDISNAISYAVTYPLSFFGHKNYTFKVTKNIISSSLKFILCIVAVFLFNNLFLLSFYIFDNKLLNIAINLVFVVCINYLLYKYFVFRNANLSY